MNVQNPTPEPVPFAVEGPQPLMREIPQGEPYPVDVLGPLQEAVNAVHDKTQAPIAIAAQSALSVASLAVQGLADVETLAGYAPTSLFCLTVAVSGERKSTCDKLLMAGLREHESAGGLDYKIAVDAYERDKRLWAAKETRLIKEAAGTGQKAIDAEADLESMAQRPEPPISPNRTATDPTFEGLVKLYGHSNPALGVFTDEAGGFFAGHGMNSDNKTKTCAGFSSLWDGSPINRTRAGDGASTLYGRRLAAHMMAQPVVVGPLLSDPVANGQGFLARFLICQPTSHIGYRTRVGHSAASDTALYQFKVKLEGCLNAELPLKENTRNQLEPRQLALSGAAKDLLQRFYLTTETAQRPEGELSRVTSYASKCAEQAARIAGVLALWADQQASEITAGQIGDGIKLAQFYLSEAMRLADAAVISQKTKQAESLRKWLLDSWHKNYVLPGDVVQLGPYSLRETAKAKEMLSELEKYGWVVKLPSGTEVRGVARKLAYRVVRGASPDLGKLTSQPANAANPANRGAV